jgi:speckle-type POZ protein
MPCKEYQTDCNIDDYGVVDFIQPGKFLCDDTLTIQVDATLFFFANPTTSCINSVSTCTTDISPSEIVLTGMKKLYEEKLFTDVTIKCGGKEFKAHKSVLASQSPVFRKMLGTDMKEKRSNCIEISDCYPMVISEMLAFIYTGSAPKIDALAKELLAVASKYELTCLFNVCQKKLLARISVASIIELLILADLYHASELKKACFSFFHRNSTQVYKTLEWQDFKENLDRAPLFIEMVEQQSK